MTLDEYTPLCGEVYAHNEELFGLLEGLLITSDPLDGFTYLLLSRYLNYKGDAQQAEEFVRRAFLSEPALLQKLLPEGNPNRDDVVAPDYGMVVITACPVCGSALRKSLYTGLVVEHICYHVGLAPSLQWVQCEKCTHVYATAQNKSEALFEGPPRSTTHANEISHQRYMNDYESIVHLADLRPKGSVLEIGAGNGTRLAAMRDMGLDVRGIEIQKSITEHCRHLGLPVTHEDFHDHTLPEGSDGYDIVVLGDVIEHLPNLGESLQKIVSLLADDGLLWISTPQYDNFILEQLRRHGTDPYFVELEHWQYFTHASMLRLMEDHGLFLRQQRYGKTFIASVEYTFQGSSN